MTLASWRSLAVAVLVLLAAVASNAQLPPTAGAPSATLVVTGSTTLLPLVSEIARRFERLHPGVKVDVQGGGSGKGIADLRKPGTDLAMVSRPLLDAERDLYAFPIVRDGVAVIVHPSNPVKSISSQQLKDVISGRMTSWKALGARDAPVALGWRGKGQGSTETVLDHLHLAAEPIAPHTLLITNEEALRFAAENPNALTLASVGEAERRVNAGLGVKLLAYNGVAASSATVRRGSYQLSRPLARVARRIPDGLQKSFIDYALSSHVRDLHSKYDFVPYRE